MQTPERAAENDGLDTGSTARIDRRRSVLAQIEAALLADRLGVLESAEQSTGTDPYNRGRANTDAWSRSQRR